MKRWAMFAAILALGVGALVVSEMRKANIPVSPGGLLNFIAGLGREVSRVPGSATRLSDEEEMKIGDKLAGHYAFELGGTESGQDRVQAYVGKVGLWVAGHAHRKIPFKFHYVPDPFFVDAFALPGGHVFIGGGLIALMNSEDELAAVLGHEVEHIDHYHCADRVQTEAILRKLPLGGLVGLPVEVFEAGYSKEQEFEADREGTRLAVRAGYSPLGALHMFEAFQKLEEEIDNPAKHPGVQLSQVARQALKGYFLSHPKPSERIEQVKEMIASEHWENLTRQRKLEVADAFHTADVSASPKAKHQE
jgi:predicted Zn-dependent protease